MDGSVVGVGVTGDEKDVGKGWLVGGRVDVTKASAVGSTETGCTPVQADNRMARARMVNCFIFLQVIV